MINIVIQLSKYIIIALMAAYTFSCFSVFTKNYEDEERRVLIRQNVLMFLMQFIAFAVMYLSTDDMRILFIYAALMIVLLGVILFIQSDLSKCIKACRQQYVHADHDRDDHDHAAFQQTMNHRTVLPYAS